MCTMDTFGIIEVSFVDRCPLLAGPNLLISRLLQFHLNISSVLTTAFFEAF